jgi:dTDP-4-amino-4,6-dideoxygalactose transaminase
VRLGADHVLAVNSGTAAIHLGLLALDVNRGDEVICSSFTFCASANPVVYCNATPVFVDSETSTWNMDPELLEEAITDRIKKTGKKPKAIVVVHLYGMPAQLDRILEVATRYEVPVLEDAAEALGSTFRGKQVGTLGALGVLSFNGNKIITASAGGALFSADAGLIARARYFRQEAREPVVHYEHKAIGYNYRFSNLLAALGRSQLKLLDTRLETRRAIFEFYQEALRSIPTISFQPEPKGSYSNRWLTSIIVDHPTISVRQIMNALEEENIESRPVWKPMHLQPVFNEAPRYGGSVSEDLFVKGLCLPSGTAMTTRDLERIVSVIKKVFGA